MMDFNTYSGQLLINFFVTGTVVVGFYLTFMSGQLSIAHQMFMGVGAYVSGYVTVTFGWSMWQSMPLTLLAATAVGVLTGLLTLRFSGMHLAIATLALAQSAVVALNNAPSLGGILGLVVPLETTGEAALVVFLAVVGFTILLERTRLGLWFRAVADDELAARALGVRIRMARLAAFGLGSAVAGLGGSMYAHHYGFIEPMTFGLSLGISLLLAMKLGGAGSVWGPILGTAVVVGLPEILRPLGVDQEIAFGAILILIVILRPDGLVGKRGDLRRQRQRLFAGSAVSRAQVAAVNGRRHRTKVTS